MLQRSREITSDAPTRETLVAYLSYALDDVGVLSLTGLQLLQLAIAAISKGTQIGERTDNRQ